MEPFDSPIADGDALNTPAGVVIPKPPATTGGAALPVRDASLSIERLIDLYMAQYEGRDMTRGTRLAWWQREIGCVQLGAVSDDDIFTALERLASGESRYFAGRDVDGRSVFKSRGRRLSGATVNRYSAAIGAVFTWAITRRVAPKGWVHPCRSVQRQTESSGKTRFLSDEERRRLLIACQKSKWSKLYLLVLMVLNSVEI